MLEESKIFCCFCCGSPPVNMNVSLPTRGFVSGETITVKVDIENLSGVDVERVRIEFRKVSPQKFYLLRLRVDFTFFFIKLNQLNFRLLLTTQILQAKMKKMTNTRFWRNCTVRCVVMKL